MIAMNSLVLKLIVFLPFTGVVDSNPQDLRRLSIANNELGVNLYHAIRRNTQDNIFFSPLSLTVAFGMLLHGAGGYTAKELLRVLGHEKAGLLDRNSVSYAIGTYMKNTWSRQIELNLANTILVDNSIRLNDLYLQTIQKTYNSTVGLANFRTDGENIKKRINDWVNRKTKGMIPALLDKVNPETAMMLINAVYFRGIWETEFDRKKNAMQDFYNYGRQPKTVEMMYMESGTFPYYAWGDRFRVVEIPYKTNMSMMIILPARHHPLSTIESYLNAPFLSTIFGRMEPELVNLRLPKFRASTSYELDEPLWAMGMRRVFGPAADFSSMSSQFMAVSKVEHKATVQVNEVGTIAAAGTTIKIDKIFSPAEAVEFVVDRPFVYGIIDWETNLVMFVGRVTHL